MAVHGEGRRLITTSTGHRQVLLLVRDVLYSPAFPFSSTSFSEIIAFDRGTTPRLAQLAHQRRSVEPASQQPVRRIGCFNSSISASTIDEVDDAGRP
jgi:hypothetical protein